MKILIALISTCAFAQINRPRIGTMLDSTGATRSAYGIASSASLGDPELTGVLSSACSKTFCLAKTETSVVSTFGNASAPPGPALFAFDDDTAFLWFRQSKQLAEWRNGVLTQVTVSVHGEVLSIRSRSGSVEFAVRRESGVWIVASGGAVLDSLPLAAGPVMLIADGAVYATNDQIVIHDLQIPLEHVTGFSRMSAGYLQVRAGGVDYALRIEKGREALFQLPGVPQ